MATTAGTIVVYFLHLVVSWSKFDNFPALFMMYEIGSTIQLLYNILIVRQHFVNYDHDLMKSKVYIDAGTILHQDLMAENPYLDHLNNYKPSENQSYNNLSSYQTNADVSI